MVYSLLITRCAIGLGWSFPCDAYSLGCILVEFYTGVALFQTHDNLEHLAMMEIVMGRMPERFGRSGARSKPEWFKEDSRLDWPKAKATRQSKKDVRMTRPLQVCLSHRPFRSGPSFNLFLMLIGIEFFTGHHCSHRHRERSVPRPCSQIVSVRPRGAHHRAGSASAFILRLDDPS